MYTPAAILRRNGTPKQFRQLDKGQTFEDGGNIWVKVSTMTAKLVWPAYNDRSFYFVNTQTVYVEQ
jgi:hypothetical protein